VTTRRRDPRPPRRLRRDGDGALYDLDERRTVSLAELAEEVQAGRRFRAHRHGSERDCTQQVLLQVLGASALTVPGGSRGLAAYAPGLAAYAPGLAAVLGSVAGSLADRREPGSSASSGDENGSAGRRRPHPRLPSGEDETGSGPRAELS
jgi:hypothetical protein